MVRPRKSAVLVVVLTCAVAGVGLARHVGPRDERDMGPAGETGWAGGGALRGPAAARGALWRPAAAQYVPPNPLPSDRFVFTRIRYGGGGYGGYGRFRRGGSSWSHDYPRGDYNLSRLLHELTTMNVELEGTNVFEIGDPEMFRHPMIYISEPGFWTMSDEQAGILREYVLKGGFLIFDDFEGYQIENMWHQLKKALPEAELVRIEGVHQIFQTFFPMDDEEIYIPHPLVNVIPVYYGVFEDNDPTKRMYAIVNHNNDIAEYWEWSGTNELSIDYTNDAYKLGINYVVYAMTH
jgi:hypothetical protein